MEIIREKIVEFWFKKKEEKYVVEYLVQQAPDLDIKQVYKQLKYERLRFATKFKNSHSMKSRFVRNHSKWLQAKIVFPLVKVRGAKKKSYENSGRKTKINRLREAGVINEELTGEQLGLAAAVKIRNQGYRDAAKKLENLAKSPDAVTMPSSPQSGPSNLSPEEAVALISRNDFSKAQYMDLRTTSLKKGINFYPPYDRVVEAKRECYPSGVTIKASEAKVNLQDLFDHTVQRLLDFIGYDVQTEAEMILICKWGADGSGGQSRYNQVFYDEDEDGELREYSDSHIFAVSMVPLRLLVKESDRTVTLWNNDHPSSVTLCRPIQIIFAKESTTLTQKIISGIKKEISELVPKTVGRVEVTAKFSLTMIDGKVANDLTESKSQACFICSRSSYMLNSPVESHDSFDEDLFEFGLSPLHAYMRAMEHLLKVAYRLDMAEPSWRVQKKFKQQVTNREAGINEALKEQLGLHINEPRQKGGNSNSGNTGRKFFNNREAVAQITGLDLELLERFAVILKLINSKAEINVNAFAEYAEETRKRYCKLYGFYPLSPTLHKLLVHGAAIIKNAVLPIGYFSEEAGESRNKSIRNFREHRARKFSREVAIEDVFKRLMLTSDPLISLKHQKPAKVRPLDLPESAIHLVIV